MEFPETLPYLEPTPPPSYDPPPYTPKAESKVPTTDTPAHGTPAGTTTVVSARGHERVVNRNMQTTTTVVINRPVPVVGAYSHYGNPYNYLIRLSFMTTFFCCFVCGIPALFHSFKAASDYEDGCAEDAYTNAVKAKAWICGAIVGFFITLTVALVVYYTRPH